MEKILFAMFVIRKVSRWFQNVEIIRFWQNKLKCIIQTLQVIMGQFAGCANQELLTPKTRVAFNFNYANIFFLF